MIHDVLSVGDCARAAAVPRGTMSCWKSRGYLPNGDSPFDETMAAAILRHLTALGLGAGDASDLVAAVRRRWWPNMVGKGTPAVLVAVRGKSGAWSAEVRSALELPAPPPAGAVVLDLGAIAAVVLARLARAVPLRDR